MAIKAHASITISHIIDISSVTRYYLLQSSTLSAPAKPTTNPPSSAWTTTEPAYTEGATSTLYFVDCTIFTNDTFSYSDVSKSSSYEAAKEAYNKAAAVEDRVSDCEISIDLNKKGLGICAIRTDVEKQISDASSSLESKIDNGLSGLESTVKKNQEDTADSIQGAKDDIQSLNDTVSQYFKFDPDGLTIMSGENSLKLRLSNDKIEFIQNGITKGWWDGNDFHTGNIYVDVSERAQFGNFAFVPRSDGSLMFLKVSDNQEVSS